MDGSPGLGSRQSGTIYTALIPLGLLILLVGVAPLASALYNAFFHDVFGRRSFAGLENFVRLFEDAGFFYSLRISMVWGLLNAGLSLFLGAMLASVLFESRRAFRWFFFALLVPWGIPIYISVPLWRMIIHGNGGISLLTRLFGIQINLLQDPLATFCAVLGVSIWMNLPLNAFVFYAVMRKIPRSVLDAAALDGAGRWVRFRRIYLPLSAGTAAVMGVLNFISSFKEFTLPFLMTAGGPPLVSGITDHHIIGATTTVEILLYDLFNTSADFGLPAAYSVVAMAVVFLLMSLWVFVKRGESRRSRYALFLAAAELLLGAASGGVALPAGLLLAGLFLLGSRWAPAFWLAVGFDLLYGILSFSSVGFLGGLHLPTLAVLASLFLLHRSRRGSLFGPSADRSQSAVGLAMMRSARRSVQWAAGGSAGGGGASKQSAGAADQSGSEARSARSIEKIGGLPAELLWTGFSRAFAVFMFAAAVLVLYMVLWLSFSDLQAAYIDRPVPRFFTLENYVSVFVEEGILRYFGNTFLVAAATGLLVPLITFPAAYAAVKMRPAGAGRLFSLVQVLGLLGGMHALIPLFAVFRVMGLINTYIPLVLIYLLHAVPFSLFSTASYLERMPRELEETARLEGAKPRQYLLRVLLPLSLPVVAAGMMVAFIGAWNGFLVPLIFLQDDALFTIGVKLHEFIGSIASGSPEWGLFAAASAVNMFFIGVLLYRFRNPLQRGETGEVM
jgi:multiple sugar transport system permease protein